MGRFAIIYQPFMPSQNDFTDLKKDDPSGLFSAAI
ncbi:MAG: hypothetical protein ACI90E_002986, partial [Yoonia sp.]